MMKSHIINPFILTACLTSHYALANTYTVDVWADNWFQFRVNGTAVAEDSVPITTERSFNAESFSFEETRPFVIGLIAKDFKQDDTGLEYIGSRRQQMGDGGVIVQIKNSKGDVVAVTNENWRCLVTHQAPLDKQCENESRPVAGEGPCDFNKTPEPTGWDTPEFDDSTWMPASIFTTNEVNPKQGYDRISWDASAQLIWGPDLETDNTVLCRLIF